MLKKFTCISVVVVIVFCAGVALGQTNFLYGLFGKVEVDVKGNTDRLIAEISQQVSNKVDEIMDVEATHQIDRANTNIETYLDQKLSEIEDDEGIAEIKHCMGYLTDNLIEEEKGRINDVIEGLMFE